MYRDKSSFKHSLNKISELLELSRVLFRFGEYSRGLEAYTWYAIGTTHHLQRLLERKKKLSADLEGNYFQIIE